MSKKRMDLLTDLLPALWQFIGSGLHPFRSAPGRAFGPSLLPLARLGAMGYRGGIVRGRVVFSARLRVAPRLKLMETEVYKHSSPP